MSHDHGSYTEGNRVYSGRVHTLLPGTVPITYLLGTNVNARFFEVPAARFSKDPATFRARRQISKAKPLE